MADVVNFVFVCPCQYGAMRATIDFDRVGTFARRGAGCPAVHRSRSRAVQIQCTACGRRHCISAGRAHRLAEADARGDRI